MRMGNRDRAGMRCYMVLEVTSKICAKIEADNMSEELVSLALMNRVVGAVNIISI